MSAAARRLLLALQGDDRSPAELPRSGTLVVGSDAERADFQVEGQGVADVHCAIGRVKGGGWALRDLGSDYGTLVNGERVTTTRLRAGDEVLIGSRRLQVVDPDAPAEPATAAAPAADTTSAPPPTTKTVRETAKAADPGQGPFETTTQRVRAAVRGHRILRSLGRGGMGQVFLAVQESLDREIAVKILVPKLSADTDFVRRFQAEARAAAALNHPNVVHVYDVGEDGGLHYLSMEYMDKGSLEERLTGEGRLEWREVLDVLHDTASALVYAEARGIVHRDIKPSNLMQNQTGATKLADLGLATHLEAEAESQDGNGDKRILGTPHFLAPEIIRGLPPDSRSDLYSLGATAYRLLTGHTPFEGASSKEILRGHLYDEPRPVSSLVPDIPEGVAELVSRLLQKDPGDRFLSAAVLLKEIDRLKSGAPPAPVAPRGSGIPRPVLVGGGAVLLVLVVAGILLMRGGDAPAPDGGGVASGPANGDPTTDPAPNVFDPTQFDPSDVGNGGTEPGGSSDGGGDDDRDLKLREAQAKVALLELERRELPLEDRRLELLAIAERFPGTTTATKARDRAAEIDAELVAQARAAAEREETVGKVLADLKSAAMLDATPPRPSEALNAMAAVAGQAELEGDADFVARRLALKQAVIDAAVDYAQRRTEEANRQQDAGDFDAMREALVDVVNALTLRELPTDAGLERVALMQTMKGAARSRIDNLGETQKTYTARRSRQDAMAVAQALSAGDGLEAEVARLDLSAATSRLDGLIASLGTGSARRSIEEIRDEVALAAQALRIPGVEFDEGTWRRKSVHDPRGRRSVVREAAGADLEGLLVEVSGGVERVPWSAFGTRPDDLHQLFNGRLTRSYSAEERRAIAALLTLSATARALEEVREMLISESSARFSPREAQQLQTIYEHPAEWAAGTPGVQRGLREREAALLLAEVLVQASGDAWASAVTGTERLLEEYEDTLLIQLLSDGTEWEEEPPPGPPDDPGPQSGTPPEDEQSDEGANGDGDGDADRYADPPTGQGSRGG